MDENREISSAPLAVCEGRSVKAQSRTTDVHVLEKSDCAVVPMNQPNKVAQAAAEVGEGRVLGQGSRRIAAQPSSEWNQQSSTAIQTSQVDSGTPVFRVTTREVLVVVIALQGLDGLHMAEGHSGKIHLDAGRHSIEVPYYQGAVNAVALELWVKPPGARSWTLFEMNDYSRSVSDTGLVR